MFLLLLLIQMSMGLGYSCLTSLLLLPVSFGYQSLLTSYYYTTFYLFGFFGMLFNMFCSCFVVFAYAMYNDTKNYDDFCCVCDTIMRDNKYYNKIKPYKHKINTYIIYTNEFVYYCLTLFRNYTQDYKFFKHIYDTYDNLFCLSNNNLSMINNKMSKDDITSLVDINKMMNNLTPKEKKEIEEFGKNLFSHKNMQKLVSEFEKNFGN